MAHLKRKQLSTLLLGVLAGITLLQTSHAGIPPVLTIKRATYGENCRGRGGAGSAPASHEQTRNLQAACSGQNVCRYTVDHNQIGDPAVGCAKSYSVTFGCASSLAAEASGQAIGIRCSAGTIRVTRATYGGNCRGRGDGSSRPASHDQTQSMGGACNGQQDCSFLIDHGALGDPAVGCAKDFRVWYDCVGAGAAAEASGKTITLSCS